MMSDSDEQVGDGVGPAAIGIAAMCVLLLVSLVAGAIPYVLTLVAVAQLPFLGGLREIGGGNLIIVAGLVFVGYALVEFPADIIGKFVTMDLSLRDEPGRRQSLRPRRRRQGRITSQLVQAIILALLLSACVTNSMLGAVVVALLTGVMEFFLDPVLERYSSGSLPPDVTD